MEEKIDTLINFKIGQPPRNRNVNNNACVTECDDSKITRICIPPYADRFFNFDNIQLNTFVRTLYQFRYIREVIVELSRLEPNVELDIMLNYLQNTTTLTKIILSGGDNQFEPHFPTSPPIGDVFSIEILNDLIDQRIINHYDKIALRFLHAIGNNNIAVISELRLYNIHIQASDMDGFIRGKPSLRRLWFHGCSFQYEKQDDMEKLASTIGKSETIEKLSFSEVDSFDLSIILYCMSKEDTLPYNVSSSLIELDLSNLHMNIIAPCIMSLLSINPSNSRLKHLSLNRCNLDNESLSIILVGIEKNSVLERFHIVNAHFDHDVMAKIEDHVRAFRRNLTLQQISIHGDVDQMSDGIRIRLLNQAQRDQLELLCTRNKRLQELVMLTTPPHICDRHCTPVCIQNCTNDNNKCNDIPACVWPHIFYEIIESSSTRTTTTSLGHSMLFHGLRRIMDYRSSSSD
jgi:hypothetical protein